MPTEPAKLGGKEWIRVFHEAFETKFKGVQVAPGWMVKMIGWFTPIMCEIHEVLYQLEQPYFFLQFEVREGVWEDEYTVQGDDQGDCDGWYEEWFEMISIPSNSFQFPRAYPTMSRPVGTPKKGGSSIPLFTAVPSGLSAGNLLTPMPPQPLTCTRTRTLILSILKNDV